MSQLKGVIDKHLFENEPTSVEESTENELIELNREFLKSATEIKPEINVNRLISHLRNTLRDDYSAENSYLIRMYIWYYFFYYPHRATRKLNREFLSIISGRKDFVKMLHDECSFLLAELPNLVDWKSSISQIRLMIHLTAHFRTDNEMARILYKDHIDELIKVLHELSRMLLQILLNQEVDYSNWETSSIFTSILSLLVDMVSVDMISRRGVENPKVIYDLTKSCSQDTIGQVLENVDSLKIPVYSVLNAMNLLVTIDPIFCSNSDVISKLLCQNYEKYGNKHVDLVGQNVHLKIIYCVQLMNKASVEILTSNNTLLMVFECIMSEGNSVNDDVLLSSITALNRWYKRVVGFLKNTLNFEWKRDEFITDFITARRNYHQKSVDLVVHTFAQKSTKLVTYLASETFEMVLEFLQLTHSSKDYDNQMIAIMKNMLKILELDRPNGKVSLKSHYLLKIIIEKSKNISLILKLMPHLKENILKGLQDEHAFNKYSTLYALMIEYDNELFNYDNSNAAKVWLDCWLKPVLDVFCMLPVGLKDLFVGQFIPKLYTSMSKILLKWIPMDKLQQHLFELSLNTDAVFVILNKLKLSITQQKSPISPQILISIVARAISHPDGVLAVEALKFILTAISPTIIIIENKFSLDYQFDMIRLFIDHHSNDESSVVRKRFQKELTKYLSKLTDKYLGSHNDDIVKGVIEVVKCCLSMFTPSTTFGQNTTACSVIQIISLTFLQEKSSNNAKIKDSNLSVVSKQLELCLGEKKVCSCLMFLLMDNYCANKDLICETLCCIVRRSYSASKIYNVNDIKNFISIILTYDIDNVTSTEFFSGYFLSILGLYDKDLVIEAFQQLGYPLIPSDIHNKKFVSGYDFLWHITLSVIQSHQNQPKLWSSPLRLSTMRKFLSFPVHMLKFVGAEEREFLVVKYSSILLDEIDRLLCYSSMVSNRVIEEEILQESDENVAEEQVVLWWKITKECCVLSSTLVELLLGLKANNTVELGETAIFHLCAHYLNIFIHGTHMGLYSATKDAFSRVLEAVWKHQEFHHIPQQLLNQVLSLIIRDNSRVDGIFSIPRRKRSAGIPLFFQIIIESSPPQFRKTLVQTLLQEIGKTVVGTWKKVGRAYFPVANENLLNSYVAFLNILQHLIEMSSISSLTESFVREMFVFVIEGLGSEEFLVKNSCQLLYGKIYKRIFNPQLLAKKLTIQQFNTRYPSIFNDAIMLLGKYHKILSANSKADNHLSYTEIKHYFYPICALLHLLIQLHPATENNPFSVDTNEQSSLTTHEQTLMINLSNLLQNLKSISYMNLRQMAYKCIISLYSFEWACHLFKTAYTSFKEIITTGYNNGNINEMKLDEIYGDYLYIRASLKVINNGSLDASNKSVSKLRSTIDPILLSLILDNHQLENGRMDLYCKSFIYDIHSRLGVLLTFKDIFDSCTLKMATDPKFFETCKESFQQNTILKTLLKNTIRLYVETNNSKLMENISALIKYCHWKLVATNLFNYLQNVIFLNNSTNIDKDWLKIISKIMDLSNSYHCPSISQEINIKALLLEMELLSKFNKSDSTSYIKKCYSIIKSVDINSLTTQNMVLFIQWSGEFIEYYLNCILKFAIEMENDNEFQYLIYACCEIILSGSSACKAVQCRQCVIVVLSRWNSFCECFTNPFLKEFIRYAGFYATVTLIFDEDWDVRNSITKSLTFADSSNGNHMESSRSCCRTLFHTLRMKSMEGSPFAKFEFICWDLLTDPNITDMIVNPANKFKSVIKQLNICPSDLDSMSFGSSSAISINDQYKYGTYSCAINSYYEWDTVQNCAADCLFSYYVGVNTFIQQNHTCSNLFLDWILTEKSTKKLSSIVTNCVKTPIYKQVVDRVHINLEHFETINSLVFYGTCLAYGLLSEVTNDDPSQVTLIKNIPPLLSHCSSHYKLCLLHEKLSPRNH